MSEPLPIPAESRRERLVIRGFAALAVIAWPATLGLISAYATHWLRLAENTFAVLGVWSITLACLGLGICVFRRSDPRTTAALNHLDFGNPALDDLLRPARPPWRARRAVCTAFAAAGTTGWVAAILYSVQIAIGVYRVAPLTELFFLGWFLGLALWCTVIVATAPAECRRMQAFTLACEAHQAQRDRREHAQRLAEGLRFGDTGEIPRPVDNVRQMPHRRRDTRYDGTA